MRKALRSTPKYKTVRNVWTYSRSHLVGKTGPRGGKRTLCGIPYHRLGEAVFVREGYVKALHRVQCVECVEAAK